ncbi:MAG: VCBS repeat-containing protein, partial [Acidobacteriia bacterium]|nr:VCBS repeat-containing protein [Terriglobia bacterium]
MSAGMSPTSMVMADFNLDGTPDLAIANESGLVSIYLGNGSGGFTASPTPAFPSGRVQVSITAGDLNGDGKPDLLVIPSGVQFPPAGTTMAYLLPGTGDGSFQTPLGTTMLVPATLFSLAVGDFSSDGRPDVAAVDSFGFGNLTFLRYDSGHGLFSGVPVFGLGAFCFSIAVADFNGDGKLDIAFANFGAGNVDVALGDAASPVPHFTPMAGSPFSVGPRPVIAVGDFNGDGKPDIAAASTTANSVTILLNAGLGNNPQTITFPPIGNQPYSPQPIALSATATSGLPVSFATSSSACAIATGNKLIFLSTGTCTITASQLGSATYAPAPPVTQSFQVLLGSQTITFTSPGSQALGMGPVALSAQTNNGAIYTITFASNTPAVCTVNGRSAILVSTGTCSITATVPGDAFYNPAPPVTVSFQVISSQAITFPTPAQATFGDPPLMLNATATSGLPVTYTSSSPSICSVSGNLLTILAAGEAGEIGLAECIITATQVGNASFAAATPVTVMIAVLKASQTITFAPLADRPLNSAPFSLAATASSGLPVVFFSTTPVVCSVSANTLVTLLALGTCTISAYQGGNQNYTAALYVTRSFTVSPVSQDYFFPHLAFGGGFQTTITYVNYLPQANTCITSFYSDSGSALPVPFPGGAIASRTDTLGPGASIHVETQSASSDPVTGGWASTHCSGPIKASFLYRLYSGGVAQGEAAVNASTTPTTEFVTFAQTQTGIAYANPALNTGSSATVTFTALDSSGNQLAATSFVLPPNAHGAANVGPLLGLKNFTGSVQITSTAPIVVLLLNFEAFPVFSSLPPGDLPPSTPLATGHPDGAASSNYTGSPYYYFPHLAFGGGFQTTLTYVNYSPQSVSCQTAFFSDSGQALFVSFADYVNISRRTDSLAPGATLHLETLTGADGPVTGGWVLATCSGPIKASLLYRLYSGGVAQGEASVNGSTTPTTEFVTFAQTQTGIALVNPNGPDALVTITALDSSGHSLAS